MQDVRTASSSCNSIFAFTALRPRLGPAPEGRWYTNEPVALMDLWHRHPGPLVVVHNTTNSACRDSGKPSRLGRRSRRELQLCRQGESHGHDQVYGVALPEG